MSGFSTNFNNNITGVDFNDLYIDDSGNISTNKDISETIENCNHNLDLFLGEYDFNISLGMDWKKYISTMQNNNELLKKDIYTILYKVKNVSSINSINLNMDRQNRILFIQINLIILNSTQSFIFNKVVS